jgi:hypothetical protein
MFENGAESLTLIYWFNYNSLSAFFFALVFIFAVLVWWWKVFGKKYLK